MPQLRKSQTLIQTTDLDIEVINLENVEKPAPGGNRLFPVFLKLESLDLLVIGGGKVGLEKLQALLNNAPETKIRLVALQIDSEIFELQKKYSSVSIFEKAYHPNDLDGAELVVVAVNDIALSEVIRQDAKARGLLVNVADKPELCDFYLGSIVTKGNLKIAISTNGKSPTIAKRLKEIIGDIIPEEMEEVLEHLERIRKRIKGDFREKVKRLNELTKVLVN